MGCSTQVRMMSPQEQALAQAQSRIGALSSAESMMLLAMWNRHTEDGVSLVELASESGHSTEWIRTRFAVIRRAIGVPEPIKPAVQIHDYESLYLEYQHGEPLTDIAMRNGCSSHALAKAFRERGYKLRTPAKSWKLTRQRRRMGLV